MKPPDYIAIPCGCREPHHTLQFVLDGDEPRQPLVYLSIGLTKPSFWQRLRYLFGFWHYAYEDVVLMPESVSELRTIVEHLEGKRCD